MIRIDPDLLQAARLGSRAAVAQIVTDIEAPLFNLAFRMLANRADAEDATQEILVRTITHLGSIREPAAAGAWAFRLACRHLVSERRRGRIEAMRLDFAGFAADLAEGQGDIHDTGLNPVERDLAIKEVKIGCTLAMLTCLSRPLRISYILGDVLEVSDAEAADALEITAATHRQRLRRARQQVTQFLRATCGVAGAKKACSCPRRVAPALAAGRIGQGDNILPGDLAQAPSPDAVQAQIARLEEGRSAAALMRSNPQFSSHLADMVTQMMAPNM